MSNKEIAKILAQIAKILEVIDFNKNRFRVIAYEKASRIVSDLTEELKNTYESGGVKALNEVEGIGESIALRIEELIKTGKSKYLAELEKEIPASEVEFLKIPGVGAKTAVRIAKELKAKSIEDLDKKLKSGEADKFFQPKSRDNLIKGIEIMAKLTDRLLLTEALPIAEDIVKKIKKFPEVKQVDFVGSLRRMKETIGDIDIVATSTNPKKVIDRFTKLNFVDHIINKGQTKSSIIHWQGLQVDLEIVPEAEYGSLLQHFTGSKDHNVALRTLAKTQGKSVSEHGIKFRNKSHKFKTEKGVYNFLGLEYIPPELRENRGEIEAAAAKKLPNLIEPKDIRGDFHVHSNWSDGLMTIEEIATAAEKLNYDYVAVSDHTVGLAIAHGLDEKDLIARQKEIEKVQKKHRIKIFSAVEVNIKADGNLDIANVVLNEIDIVIASIHSSFRQSKELTTERLLKTINNPAVDIIGHPSGRIIGQREPCEIDWQQVFEACAKTKTALEISAFPNRLDLADNLVKEAKSYGVNFAINTDSHHENHLNLMRYGISVARRGWLEKSQVINTMSLSGLSKWLDR